MDNNYMMRDEYQRISQAYTGQLPSITLNLGGGRSPFVGAHTQNTSLLLGDDLQAVVIVISVKQGEARGKPAYIRFRLLL